jgi:hypothetical protein
MGEPNANMTYYIILIKFILILEQFDIMLIIRSSV